MEQERKPTPDNNFVETYHAGDPTIQQAARQVSYEVEINPRSVTRVRPGPIEVTQLAAEAMKIARALANGDPRRIEVIDKNTAIVHNHSRPRRP